MGSIKQNYANNVLSSGKFDATDLTGTIPNTNINDNSIDNVTSFPAAGSGIPSVASDPPSPSVGDVWYNTTSNAFKYLGATTVGSWATGNDLNNPRFYLEGAGTQTSTIIAGGERNPGGNQAFEEVYNGTYWTEVNDLNTARWGLGALGADSTAAIVFGGATTETLTESWNGSSWSEVNDLNTGRWGMGEAGNQTNGLIFSGIAPPALSPRNQIAVESWNGTSWTETTDMNTARYVLGSAGTQTSALGFGGNLLPGDSAATESWNGTSWTEVNDLNTGRSFLRGFGADNTSALGFGGESATAITEEWNGTSWTETTDLNTARGGMAGSGTVSSGLAAGGSGTPQLDSSIWPKTEEWTGAGSPVTKTVTTA